MFNMPDVNKLYNTPAERMLAAQSALSSSIYGMGNLIRAEMSGDFVEFVSSATGKRSQSLQAIISEVGSFDLTNFSSINVGTLRKSGRSMAGNKLGAIGGMLDDITNSLKNKSILDELEAAGISQDFLKDFRTKGAIDVLTMHGSGKNVAQRIQTMRKRGQLHGIDFLDDEGGRLLQFRAGKQVLNSAQSNLLLSITGHGILDPEAMTSILASGDPGKLAKHLMKVPKRARSLIAEREVSIAGGELAAFLGNSGKSMEEAFVMLDPHSDIMKMYAGIKDLGSADKNAYYFGNKASENFNYKAFTSGFDKLTNSQQTKLKALINANKTADGKSLLSTLEKSFGKGSDEMKIIKQVFDSIEYDFDGSDILNVNNLKNYKKSLRDTIKSLDPVADKNQIASIEAQIRAIDYGIESGDQITGRGRIAGIGADIKTAFQVRELKGPFANKAGIITTFGTKGELGLMGKVDSLLLSGFGEAKDFVYADPVSAAFNPDIFADRQTQAAIRQNSERVLQEFKDAANSSVLPEKIKGMLQKSVDVDLSVIDPSKRASAMRNRLFAQQILDLNMSGIGPKQSPQMMNLLHSFMAAQAFREKDGFIQPVLPDTHRFAVDSETILHRTGSRSLLSRQSTPTQMMLSSGGQPVSNELVNFRVKGHKMLFAQNTIGNIRHTLGGFDLDDKGLPKLTTFMDENNKRRMAFHVYRQPSGPEEVLLTRANMDVETIQSLFGGDEFRSKLDEMISGISDPDDLRRMNLRTIKDILDSNLKDISVEDFINKMNYSDVGLLSGGDDIESAIISVMEEIRGKDGIHALSDKAIRRFGQYGASSLTVEDVTGEPGYTRQAIFKVKEAAGEFDMRNEISKVLQDGGYSKKVTNKMNKIISQSSNFEEVMQRLSNISGDREVQAVMSAAYQEKARVAQATGGDILGLYVNRSMAVGSFLDQYEDFLNMGSLTKAQKEYMLKNYKIGLLAQETAIDAAINFSGSKKFSKETLDLLVNGGGSLDVQAISKTISELGGFGADMSLDQLGEAAVKNLGRIAGFGTATNAGANFSLGFDQLLLTERLKSNDIKILLGGIIEGMNDSLKLSGTTGTDDVRSLLSDLESALQSDEYDRMQQVLLKRFGLSASSQYASLSAIDQSSMQATFDAVRKGLISNIAMDPTLSSSTPSREAQSVAKAILEKHKDDLDAVYKDIMSGIKDLSDQEAVAVKIRSDRLGSTILSDIQDAAKVQGVTMQDLVDALDFQSQSQKIPLSKIGFITGDTPTEYERTATIIENARKARRARYYQNMLPTDAAGNVINQTLDNLSGYLAPNEKFTIETMDAQVRRILDDIVQGNYGVVSSVDEDILRSLIGETIANPDEVAVMQAQREAEIVRQQLIMDDLTARGALDDLGVAGTIADPTQAPDDGFTRAAVNASLSDLEDDSDVAKATYKRFRQAVQDGDISKLFENKMIKRGTLAIGALAVGSFIYSSVTDRTQDDMQGPPLLPGGSAYEQGLPNRVPEIGSFGQEAYQPGMNYRVNISGGQGDIDRFNQAASGLNISNYSTTMYNKIPDLSANPLMSFMDYL